MHKSSTDMMQAQSRIDVLAGVERFGVAPGGRKMMDIEEEAAEQSIQTGLFGFLCITTTNMCCDTQHKLNHSLTVSK